MNHSRYPQLDPDFISQICFEHPARFELLFPNFDPDEHQARRIRRSVTWVKDNLRYDGGEKITFWHVQFDEYMDRGNGSPVFNYMVQHKAWSFPPVIVESRFAGELGAPDDIGRPFYLVEGTHRVSYLLRMEELGLVTPDADVELIEIATNNRLSTSSSQLAKSLKPRS